PKNEGKYVTNIFADAMCIPTGAQNVEAAHEYINFMLSYEPAKANAEYIYYASPYNSVIDDDEYKEYLGEDYEVIYDPEFGNIVTIETENGEKIEMSYIEYMFNTYAYRDLSDENRAKLNGLWESLKVDSDSFGGEIYIICAVILVLLIGFIIYKYIEKRKRRRLYWNVETQPKVTVSRNDFSSTTMYNAVKEKIEEENKTEVVRENALLIVDESDGKTHKLKKK
ncbi:MAG: hypothetical protein IKA02_01435, partial [Clostridia bacterium]|nr:hypothetical protein [Clostridia bacterium]